MPLITPGAGYGPRYAISHPFMASPRAFSGEASSAIMIPIRPISVSATG